MAKPLTPDTRATRLAGMRRDVEWLKRRSSGLSIPWALGHGSGTIPAQGASGSGTEGYNHVLTFTTGKVFTNRPDVFRLWDRPFPGPENIGGYHIAGADTGGKGLAVKRDPSTSFSRGIRAIACLYQLSDTTTAFPRLFTIGWRIGGSSDSNYISGGGQVGNHVTPASVQPAANPSGLPPNNFVAHFWSGYDPGQGLELAMVFTRPVAFQVAPAMTAYWTLYVDVLEDQQISYAQTTTELDWQ